MRTAITSIFIVILFGCSAFSQQLTGRDLKVLEGGTWVGELTYLDYGTKKKTSIKSHITISPKQGSAGTRLFAYT